MERNKNAILKSKSSSMKAPKPQADKFWSNANIKKEEQKKRGLYVERKPARFSISGFPGQDERESPLTQRRPKLTRTEVLPTNLQLDNATTATQFSIQNIDVPASPRLKKRLKLLNKMFNPDDGVTETAVEKQTRKEKKKSKYHSKILNDKEHRSGKNSVVILQAKKNIDRIRSSHTQWSSEELNKTASKHTEKVLDQKSNFEPTSAVEEHPQKPEEKELFNFFVDLLQTSFTSDYKMKEVTQSNDEDSIKFEIDEKVVEKLKLKPTYKKEEKYKPEVKVINESASYSYQDDYRRNVYNTRVPTRKKKEKNTDNPQKRRRETKKEKIINKIKRELEMEDAYVYEPPTMFDALKAIAQQKKKVLRFQEAEPIVMSKSKKRNNKACFRGRDIGDKGYTKTPFLERKSKHSSSSSNWYGDDDIRFVDIFDAKGYDERFNADTMFNRGKLKNADEKLKEDLLDSNLSSVSYSSFKMANDQQAGDKVEVKSIFENKKNFDEFLPVNDEFF